jgi:hypothetical protein
MLNNAEIWIPLSASIIPLTHLWVKYLSARVKLQTDLRLLKLARSADVETGPIVAAINERIRAIYATKIDVKQGGDDDTVSGNILLAGICFWILWGCIRLVADGIFKLKGVTDSDYGGIIVGTIFGSFCAYGIFVGIRDGIKLSIFKRRKNRKDKSS